jgi:hypothetical protein
VVRAGGAQRGQRRQVGAADEFEHGGAVVEVAQLVFVLADLAAQQRHQRAASAARSSAGSGVDLLAAEHRLLDVRASQSSARLMIASVIS